MDGKAKENAVLIEHDETKIKWLLERFYSNVHPSKLTEMEGPIYSIV